MTKLKIQGSWKFNKNISVNFDEHVKKSIPMYNFLQKNIAKISEHYIKKNTTVIDVGCSTGNTIIEIIKLKLNFNYEIIGLDESKEMINIANSKISNKFGKKIKLKAINFSKFTIKKKADLIIASLVTPFMNNEEKKKFYDKAYNILSDSGALILVEKIDSSSSNFQNILTNLYYDFKLDNGLSNAHIIKKSKSLRSSMSLQTYDKLIKNIKRSKFKNFEIFYKVFNFIGLIITK